MVRFLNSNAPGLEVSTKKTSYRPKYAKSKTRRFFNCYLRGSEVMEPINTVCCKTYTKMSKENKKNKLWIQKLDLITRDLGQQF